MISAYKKGSKTPLSSRFNSSHFDCLCTNPECQSTYIDSDLVILLEEINKRVGVAQIDSAFRCTRHNIEVMGKPGSQHLLGKACDFKPGLSVLDSVETLLKSALLDKCGLGQYPSFIHVDVRGYRARWKGIQ